MLLPLRPSERDRLRVVDRLKRGYVAGRLSTETFEARVAVAHTAPSRATLRALMADLSARWLAVETVLASGARADAPVASASWATLLLTRCAAPAVLVGRSHSCDVVLGTDAVSRRHARFERSDGEWHVSDLGSMNGTWLEGVRVDRAPVFPGSRVQLGDVCLDVA